MSIVVNKGAVKFQSIRAMARSIAEKTQEPEDRVYIRLWKRLNHGKSASTAYHLKPRHYNRKSNIESAQVSSSQG